MPIKYTLLGIRSMILERAAGPKFCLAPPLLYIGSGKMFNPRVANLPNLRTEQPNTAWNSDELPDSIANDLAASELRSERSKLRQDVANSVKPYLGLSMEPGKNHFEPAILFNRNKLHHGTAPY